MMAGEYTNVMTISTAVDFGTENLIIKARFDLDRDFRECSYEFQQLLMEQIYKAFGEMLENVTEKAEWERNIEQLMYEDETIEEFQERTKDDPELQKIYDEIDQKYPKAAKRSKLH